MIIRPMVGPAHKSTVAGALPNNSLSFSFVNYGPGPVPAAGCICGPAVRFSFPGYTEHDKS